MSFPISITFDIKSPPTAAFDALASSAQKLDQSMQASASNFDKFGQSVSQLESPLSSVGGSMGQLEGSMSGLEGSLGSAAGGMGEFAGSTEQLNGALSETGGFVTDASTSMSDLSGTTSETGGAMGELSGTTGEFNGVIGETGGFVQETGTAMGELSTTTGETGTAMGELNTTTGETNTAMGELSPLVTETQTGFAEMVPVVQETGTGMTDLTTATDETNTALETSVDALGNVVPGLADTATGAADSAQGFSDLRPAVDDTNTALDSSSGLLEGVSPLLADTGTNAGTAATETDTFSGALGGMNTELGPVNGGLTTENTLLGDVGESAVTTAQNTGGLKDSMSTLAFGLTTVVGAGYGLVNSFLAIRDAGFRVDAANIRVEKSATALDKAMLGVSKAIQKLATDSEAPIQGMGRLQTAFAAFQKLIDAGILSGPKYTEALNNLKLAADGLEGSTIADKNAIEALNIQIGSLGTKVLNADLQAKKLNKTLEAQTKSYVDAGMSIATLVGGMGAMIQTLTGAGAAAGLIKGAFIDLSIVASQSLIPAIAGIAVPVGIAVAAIGAFIGVVTAIRANLGVFDELGMKIGQVFPDSVGFLNDARQAFINLSDGINTSISVALGFIDQMTGGVANLQAQWEGFTDTLPKGTGELGLAGKALGQLDHIMHATGEQINIGKGKWTELNGVLVAFGGAVKVASGGWHEMRDGTAVYTKAANEGTTATKEVTTAMDAMGPSVGAVGFVLKEQSANYSELTAAQKFAVAAGNSVIESLAAEKEERARAVAEAQFYLGTIEGITPAVGLSGAAIVGMSNALRGQTSEHFKAVSAASEYIQQVDAEYLTVYRTDAAILAHAKSLKEQEKATGKATDATAKHVEELTKLQQAHTDAAAEILYYSDATNMANRMQIEYQAGVDKANLAIIDQQAALANTAGELQRNFELLDEGTLQEIAYGQGVAEAAKKLQDKILALEKMKGAYDATNAAIQEGTIVATEFATGIQETKTAIQQNALALVKLAGELEAYSQGTTTADANNQAMVRGFLEQKKALIEVSQEYANAAGAVEALRMELASSEQAVLRFNKGVMDGRKSALELMVGMEEARGEAIGFRTELLSAATAITKGMGDMSRKSTEALQQIIEVASGVPGAFEKVVQGIDAMGQKIIDTLTDAAQESKEKFMDEIEAMEKDLGTKFSKPIVQELYLQARVEDATRDIETAMGVFASMLRDKPLEVALQTQQAQDALKLLQAEVDKAAALSPKFQPLQTALNNLAAWSPSQGMERLPVLLTDVLQGAQAMEGGMQGAITAFDSMFSAAAQTQSGLDALKTAFTNMGLTFDTTTGKLTDATGTMIHDFQVMGEGATNAATTTDTALTDIGASGDAARVRWANIMTAMTEVVRSFTQDSATLLALVSVSFQGMATFSGQELVKLATDITTFINSYLKPLATTSQSTATTVSGSFSNMASNTRASMNTMASGIIIIIASFTKMGTDATRGATTVSTAFTSMGSRVTSATNTARSSITTFTSAVTTMAASGSKVSSFGSTFASAMSRVQSSASSAKSAVSSLQSAINSLKSKTIVITTVLRTVRQFVASGGAFIATSPTHVGPFNVSEFGQAELVTVTPLQNPSGQTITGPGMQVSTSGPGAKAFAKSGDESISLGGPMNGGPLTPAEVDKKAREFIDSVFKSIDAKVQTKKGGTKVTLIRELPIIIKVDGKTISDAVNRRIFEISDSILA